MSGSTCKCVYTMMRSKKKEIHPNSSSLTQVVRPSYLASVCSWNEVLDALRSEVSLRRLASDRRASAMLPLTAGDSINSLLCHNTIAALRAQHCLLLT